ncbi:MAG: hypothetical protein E7273_10565 [Pseudobutyrivibrio ruminis]|nr:hypothetical protein [Pseudobutyrivibrio ruminis]
MIKTRQEALMALGLGISASEQQIKMAYKDLVKKCHPDVTGSSDASAYNRIVEAYNFLCKDNGNIALTHSKVVGKTTKRQTASNADYYRFQKKAEKAKQRKKEEFEKKQKDFAAQYEKQEADYKRAMEAIDAIRVARSIQSMIWANGMEKDWDDDKN